MAARHYSDHVLVPVSPEDVFAFVDDHTRFSSHMSESSWMMGGGRMSVNFDDAKGKTVGSHIRLRGRVFGLSLFVDEVVIRRDPPRSKVWQTIGRPRLLVIGAYTMGVEVTPATAGTRLSAFIDYNEPVGRVTKWLGRMFGKFYAWWCVDQMLVGTVKFFESQQRAVPD